MYTFSACLPPAHHLKIWFQVPSKHLQLNGKRESEFGKERKKKQLLEVDASGPWFQKGRKKKYDRKVLLVGVSLAVGICL